MFCRTFLVNHRTNKNTTYLCRKIAVAVSEKPAKTKKWIPVIGLEVHAQILSKSKLFSGASTQYGGPTNNQVAFLDAGLPGTLPVMNKRCVEAGILTALALKCDINPVSTFDRKHYFYADLPVGYQITQQRQPIGVNGKLKYLVLKKGKLYSKSANITQLQLEQDSGKSLHDTESGYSLIDLNRAGTGLMEIVTEPDFCSGEEAAAFVKELQLLLQTLGTCNGKMEEGALRVDASVSIRLEGEPLGIRSEVKNINSSRYVAQAVEYEIKRQIKLKESGGEVANETRSFDYESRMTIPMRDKEKLHDYRFMPEPNLPPLWFYWENIAPEKNVKSQAICIDDYVRLLPELPEETRTRITHDYALKLEQADVIINEPGMLEYFQKTMDLLDKDQGYAVAKIITNQLMELLNKDGQVISQCPITPYQCASLIEHLHIHKGITHTTAKKVLSIMYTEPLERSAKDIVDAMNWHIVSDESHLRKVTLQVLEKNTKAVQQYRKGKKKIFHALFGEIQKTFEDCANNEILTKILQELLNSEL